MIVLPEKKKLVLNTSKHEDVVKVIPHAKTFEHSGKTLTALKHGVEETVVLRNMGFKKTPAPILHYYDWPARFKPMEHQRQTAAFLTLNRRALCLNAPGTGKSISTLWAADYLLSEGVAKKVLIIAPLSTLKPVWGKELKHHLPHRSFKIITGTKEARLRAIESAGVQYLIINHDGFTNLREHLKDCDVVIYDEATALKSPSSQRYRLFSKWMQENDPWLWMLTGTPISQNPVDAWTLARLVQSPVVPKSFTAFKDRVMQKVTTFKWVPRSDALDVCKQVLQPSIRYSLDECKDLPDTVYIDREVDLTVSQARAFKLMQEDCIVALNGAVVTAANAAVMFGKLLQIACGVVYDVNGNHQEVDSSNRYEGLRELLDEVGGKCIVFVPFRGVQDYLKEKLLADGYDVELVNGDVGKTERDKIFDDFQNSDKIRVLLAHPKVAAHGLTLTRAQSIVWFAPIYSLESYEQANARIRRLTTAGKTTVYHLYATTLEKELYKRLKTRQSVLSDFLEMVRGINE